jgi:GcrA cell cycle regulator
MNSWTAERVEILKRMWGDGATCAAIAVKLGFGTTRNAVIGKALRIGLPGRPSPIRRGDDGPPPPPKPRVVRLKPVVVKPEPAVRKFAVKFGNVSACRWPEGDPKHTDFHFCEAKTEPGRPYCHAHCERAYQKPENENTRRMAAE